MPHMEASSILRHRFHLSSMLIEIKKFGLKDGLEIPGF